MDVRDIAFALWRRLPVSLRQNASKALFDRLHPRLDDVSQHDVAGRDVPRIVVGFLSSPSGIGQSARLTALALQAEGYSVYGIDLSAYFHERSGVIEHGLSDGRPLKDTGHVIICINAPYLPYALTLLGRSFLQGKYVTGYWAWELPRLPNSWKKGFLCVHDIAVPSRFVADAVRQMNLNISIVVAPHPVAIENHALQSIEGAPIKKHGTSFTIISVMSVGSGFERKNPVALIKAFKLAFENRRDCRLRMLISNAEHYPPARSTVEAAIGESSNIEVNWASLARDEFVHWWGAPDVYASLHRSEGFGLPLAEAMCAGIPVIATGWSGNMDFMTPDNSLTVGYRLVDVQDPQRKYSHGLGQWADPDISHASELLQALERNQALARELGQNAARSSRDMLSSAKFCKALIGAQL